MSADAQTEEIHTTKWLNFKNTLHIGVLNYKSRPKFTLMMTFALFVCAITMFLVISLFGQSLIQPTMTTLDNTGVEGKVILSNRENDITQEQLDEVAGSTKAGFFLPDRELSEFTVSIPRTGGMLQSYDVTCLYSPYEHNLEQGEAVLVLPSSVSGDADAIRSAFLNAGVGIYEISVENTLDAGGIYLYLACDDLNAYGEKMQALYSGMTLGTDETTVYTFEIDESLLPGQVDLVNSNYYAADGKTVVFGAKADKSYTVMTSNEKNEEISGLIVQMNEEDYAAMFAGGGSSVQSALYYGSDEAAAGAVASLPAGYMGMLSTTQVYVQDAMDIFTANVLWYIVLIAVSIVFAMLISVIFMRSVKIYQADFAVYRTLGISRKISSRSLYIQMLLIFLPTLLLLPVISLIATVIPGSSLAFISAGNYFFIEAMMLLIVEFVAFGFNKSINGQSIRKSLRRGSK